jgi:NAD(P)-dependent dehydrogenase (short-subunit alcohol dehydrogenase family)
LSAPLGGLLDERAFAGKTALVTGASRGIGLAVAAELARRGAWVGMVARSRSELEEAARAVGGHAIPADVSDAEAVHGLAEHLDDVRGEVPDFVVNSAGTFALAPLAETDPEVFERQLAVNLRGPFLVMRALLPRMLRRRSGHLVSIGSVAGRVAYPGNAAYAASKFGLRGVHEVLAEEVRGSGVRATLIEPSATDTPLWDPLDPDARDDLPARSAMLRPEDVARAVAFVLSQPEGVEVPLLSLRFNR